MAHETAVHRADGQITVGTRPVIDPVIATDGIDEWLGFGTEPGTPSPALPEGKVLHLHTTDDGLTGEWLISGGPDGITVQAGHGKGDAAVRGPASALMLLLVRRLAPDDPAIEVIGDRAVLDGWLAATPF
jgi:hypothetical protein